MITDGAAEYYSAKDLLEWQACAHSAALSLRLPTDRRLQEYLRSMSEEIS